MATQRGTKFRHLPSTSRWRPKPPHIQTKTPLHLPSTFPKSPINTSPYSDKNSSSRHSQSLQYCCRYKHAPHIQTKTPPHVPPPPLNIAKVFNIAAGTNMPPIFRQKHLPVRSFVNLLYFSLRNYLIPRHFSAGYIHDSIAISP